MPEGFLGIDTSNYTTSCAVYLPDKDSFLSLKQLLPVEKGSIGLRQSDAVFHHSKNLPILLKNLYTDLNKEEADITSVAYSYAPRDCEGSYMPCFSVGEGYAQTIACVTGVNAHRFSHQAGHIAAALWSSGRTDLIGKEFIAFHVSGGTTDVLYVKPDKDNIFSIETAAASLDLKAGQAVDRVGAMLSLGFPAGPQIDALACTSSKAFRIKPYEKDGSCSFSGLENKCRNMLDKGEKREDIAKYCIDYISAALKIMTECALKKYGGLPLVYAGGVMSNSIINRQFSKDFGASFAKPEYSSDNAAGTAYLGYLKESL